MHMFFLSLFQKQINNLNTINIILKRKMEKKKRPRKHANQLHVQTFGALIWADQLLKAIFEQTGNLYRD